MLLLKEHVTRLENEAFQPARFLANGLAGGLLIVNCRRTNCQSSVVILNVLTSDEL